MKLRKRAFAVIVCSVAICFVVGGCSKEKTESTNATIQQTTVMQTTVEPTTQVIPTISINTNNVSLPAGGTSFLIANVSPKELTNEVVWSSDNDNIVEVDSGGRIDALAVGSATVTAKIGDVSATCKVTVTASENNTKTSFSTAITANQSIIDKNLKDNKYKLPYYIKVNRQKNCVTVYTYNDIGKYTVPVRAMICSTGADNATVTGEFSIGGKYRWLPLFGNVYGQYVSGFYGNYLFHSVPYYDEQEDTLEADQYNLLGQSVSMGCVRLAVADAKWIYDNCDNGTGVTVYDDDKDGPLGTPKSMKIPQTYSDAWDPTDSNSKNPYNEKTPQIFGAEDATINKGDIFEVKENVTAKDTCGNDITKKIEIVGSVNTEKPGKYRLTYRVLDDMNRSAQTDRYITVE